MFRKFSSVRWHTSVTAKEITSRQKNNLEAKEKDSRQKEEPHGRKKKTHGKRKKLHGKKKRLSEKEKTSLPRARFTLFYKTSSLYSL